jgi:glutamate dehydrogenase
MATRPVEDPRELIDTVCERVRERVPSEQVVPAESFVRHYYRWVPAEDLEDRSPIDLYGAAIAQWNLALRRAVGQSRVHVYNPNFESHGWASAHSVLEVVSDDMPFLVDSVTMALSRLGYGTHLVIHPVIRVLRDATGTITAIAEDGAGEPESIIHVEFDRQPDRSALSRLKAEVEQVLEDVRAAVEDWGAMRGRASELIDVLGEANPRTDPAETSEAQAFLRWLSEDHFTFLGYREYELQQTDGAAARLVAVGGSGLGILRSNQANRPTQLSEKALQLALDQRPLLLTKANSRATVHRPAYLDYVGVKRFAPDGQVLGEYRFLGLYTSSAYRESVLEVPLIRGKVAHVLEQAGFPPDSHDAKALLEICETYPRDSLFQLDRESLLRTAIGILGLGERQRVRVFTHPDPLDRFVDCIVCVPRDRFNTDNRERVARILQDAFHGDRYAWTIQLTESNIARLQIVVHTPQGIPADIDERDLELRIVAATRNWTDDLRDALIEEHGEQAGLPRFGRYQHAFPAAYRSDWLPRSAVTDIVRLEELERRGEPIVRLYRPLEARPGIRRCKLFSQHAISLSQILPTFEHLGARVIDEHPYEIRPTESAPAWIYDFGMRCPIEDVDAVHDLFEQAFLAVWRGELEDNALNELVLLAGLDVRALTVVHAIARYLRQAGIPFSDGYVQRTLVAHPGVVALMVQLFSQRLDPERMNLTAAQDTERAVVRAIDEVSSLDEDRILRSFLHVVQAILRTNHYVLDATSVPPAPRNYLSFKLDPAKVPILPLPRPRFEIFVYSPRVEGIHLRGGSVARGRLRWSDRPEDFRTEILGLMKAQMVKNALIVPVGSKGGFVVKHPPNPPSREELQAEGIRCYQTFLRGLLDLTDNIVDGKVVPPAGVVRHEGDDPYLVVAADKGTATFSDIANAVSLEYGFWLGDAFASGGSQGYDHKAMGITARGAWESVKRHFRGLGTDIQTTDFTVVGIGDMAGDVFGNGMLLSEHIRLIAAFNHLHIFLDPDPDPALSLRERRRLFELPRSAWSDYDPSLISEGGGVYSRAAKEIQLTAQVQAALGIEAERLAPNDLIAAILRAPVDLLFNGGIGTYVKAAGESHADVGDKANDAVRVNGGELRARVVGEGGNLGLTQRGRIEYALAGGLINTDAIDNVAGVNCSDHEVNIKILLNALLQAEELTEKQRNELLVEMTDSVAHKVLYGSYTQTQALGVAVFQAASMLDVHARMIRRLERDGGLNREIEFLPSDSELSARRRAKQGLCSPELAVVMAYVKIQLYDELLRSDLPEDPYLGHDLERYFPPPLPERYAAPMREHRLRREIIATLVANQLVDRAGTTFAFRLREETGAPVPLLARAYAVAREVFGMRQFWAEVEQLDNRVHASTQTSMLIDARRLVERAARRLVRSNPVSIEITDLVARYEAAASMLAAAIPAVLDPDDREAYAHREAELLAAGVPAELARQVAAMSALPSTFDIVEVAAATGRDPEIVMRATFAIAARLQISWLRERILELPRGDRWQALARAALRDDLASLTADLAAEVLLAGGPEADSETAIATWEAERGAAVERCLEVLSDIRASRTYDTTTLPVALRELRNLASVTA